MTDIAVKPDLDSGDTYTEANFLRVHTYVRTNGADKRVATFEHMFNGTDIVDPEQPAWHIRTLVQSKPLSHEQAMDFGRRYATAKNIPVIYERRD